MRTSALVATLAALSVTLHSGVSARGQQPQQKQLPTFRSAVTLVPIDVRVVENKTGKAVTDMRQDEFTVIEDGVKQEVKHLSLQTFVTEGTDPGSKLQLKEDAISFEPQKNRIFLIVLGRGKLQEPSKTMDALLQFVRERLLPRDQVAVFAYNRASTFSTDHEQIARILDRFKKDHEQIDFEIELQMSGLAALYGAKLIPKSLQGKIDKMFEGAGLLASQRVDAGASADKRIGKDSEQQVNAQIQKQSEAAAIAMMAPPITYAQAQAQMQAGLTPDEAAAAEKARAAGVGYVSSWSQIDEIQTQMFSDLSLEDFVSATAQTLQDLGNIYAGINYLKHFEGEKHLIFFTEKGLTLPRLEEDVALAQAANDARVAIDNIETGGIYVGQPPLQAGLMPEGTWNQTFAFKALRNISEFTGGVSSIAEDGAKAMDRINDVTRATYLLGYYPTNTNWDGSYRKVQIKTSRPGVTVLYRQGYYGRKEMFAFNRRDFITNQRIQAAAGFRRTINDIHLKFNAKLQRAQGGQGYELSTSLSIDPANLAFTFVEGVHNGRITIALYCFDERGNLLVTGQQTADLKLKDEDYKAILGKGIPYAVTVPIDPGVRRVRAVVYDFKADLVGTSDQFVK
jgi:VWFA-related protein